MGVYRAKNSVEKSLLPFVCTSPRADMELALRDKIYVFCNPIEMHNAFQKCLNARLVYNPDGTIALGAVSVKPSLGACSRTDTQDSVVDFDDDDDD